MVVAQRLGNVERQQHLKARIVALAVIIINYSQNVASLEQKYLVFIFQRNSEAVDNASENFEKLSNAIMRARLLIYEAKG